MKRVIIESPYAGQIFRNILYARACVKDSLQRGEAPLASHLLYTQPNILDDEVVSERSNGILAGHMWIPYADCVVAYLDFGISKGMCLGMDTATRLKIPVVMRRLSETDLRNVMVQSEFEENTPELAFGVR